MTIEQLQEELAKLREDYNQLERDFDSMSEGYQESLLLFDRLEETCHELEEKNTDRITRLVNKMLELSDANCQSVIERNDHTTALQIVAEAIEASAIAAAPHLDFTMHVAAEAEAVELTTNRQSAVRALTLILGNALKFTKPAEAHARHDVPKEKKEASLTVNVNDSDVCFVVEDTGIGIINDNQQKG